MVVWVSTPYLFRTLLTLVFPRYSGGEAVNSRQAAVGLSPRVTCQMPGVREMARSLSGITAI